jgi:hypothetical protein
MKESWKRNRLMWILLIISWLLWSLTTTELAAVRSFHRKLALKSWQLTIALTVLRRTLVWIQHLLQLLSLQRPLLEQVSSKIRRYLPQAIWIRRASSALWPQLIIRCNSKTRTKAEIRLQSITVINFQHKIWQMLARNHALLWSETSN